MPDRLDAEHSNDFEVSLTQIDGFEFRADFDQPELASLTLDEPPPLGEGRGPNAARLLGAAVGNCLSASLVLCLRKSRIPLAGVETSVRGSLRRNDAGRLRIGSIQVDLRIDVTEEAEKRIDRCLGLFEDFCIVTASVRRGIDVGVSVSNPRGERLWTSEPAAAA